MIQTTTTNGSTMVETPAGTVPPETNTRTYDGTIVSLSGTELVMSGHDNKEHSHTVALDAMVTCDGTVCRTEDLKTGAKIRLTIKTDEKHMATKIESLDKQPAFAPST
jgi:hypothetical protein